MVSAHLDPAAAPLSDQHTMNFLERLYIPRVDVDEMCHDGLPKRVRSAVSRKTE